MLFVYLVRVCLCVHLCVLVYAHTRVCVCVSLSVCERMFEICVFHYSLVKSQVDCK